MSRVGWADGKEGMNVPVGKCLNQSMVFRRQRKREKVAVGPGSREYKAGYETRIVDSCA